MYKCNTCIYKNSCCGASGAHGVKPPKNCLAYKRDTAKNREELKAIHEAQSLAEVERINAKYKTGV